MHTASAVNDSAESREGLREISQSCYASGQALAKPDENGQQRCWFGDHG